MMTETVVTVQPNNNKGAPQAQGGAANGAGQQQHALSWLKINADYFRTLPGWLKLAQLIIGIICMICASPAYIGGTHWFLFVITISFIGTLIWVFVYLLGIREALNLPIDWILSELVNTAIVTLFYCIAFIVQLAAWSGYSGGPKASNIVAGVFAIFNTLCYGYGVYLLHLERKSNST